MKLKKSLVTLGVAATIVSNLASVSSAHADSRRGFFNRRPRVHAAQPVVNRPSRRPGSHAAQPVVDRPSFNRPGVHAAEPTPIPDRRRRGRGRLGRN